jgi:acyl-coenzyme A synthetase/AMP-(fatty) acid ligase
VERLRDLIHRNLAETMHPGHIKIVSEFPMTRSGKVQKYRLAELAAKEFE